MTKRSSLMSKVMVLLLAFAVVFTYSVMPMNQAYAASAKKPAKVAIKSAKATSPTTVQVKWKKAKNAKKYEVFYSTNSKKGFKKGATVKGAKKVTAVVKNLKPSTKYYFKVRAVNGKKKGKYSKVKAATTQAAPKPTPAPTPAPSDNPASEQPADMGERLSRTMTYNIDMTDETRYPKGSVVEVWVPVPSTDTVDGYQIISNEKVEAEGDAEAVINTEEKFGNRMAYIKWDAEAEPATRKATVSFDAVRFAVSRSDLKENASAGIPADVKPYITEESTFVKVNADIVKKYAAEATAGKTGTLEKARAIYEWVIGNLERIDNGEILVNEKGEKKTFKIEGCGYGDTVQILTDLQDFGRAGGHCTDINSTFVALCRASGIPAKEMFGLRMSTNATGGQHCWAQFYLPGTGWVFADPGDVLKFGVKGNKTTPAGTEGMSVDEMKEARASEETEKYTKQYWGGVDNNRVQLSVGRDVVLNPAQKADPRNTFGYPYAEVDGKTEATFDYTGRENKPENPSNYNNVDAQGDYIDCTVGGAFKYTIDGADAPVENEVLVDARTPEVYAGWAVDGNSKGGHLDGAANIAAQWIDMANDDLWWAHPSENKSLDEAIDMEIEANGLEKDAAITVYDTNGTDANKVAKYLRGKGFNNVAAVNKKDEIDAADTLVSYKNYELNVPAEVVKNISDYKLGEATELTDAAKKIVGSADKDSIKLLHAEYWGVRDAEGNVDFAAKNPKGKYSSYYGAGHVPGAEAISTDDFEPETYPRGDRIVKQDGVYYGWNDAKGTVYEQEDWFNTYRWIGSYELAADNDLIALAGKYGIKSDDVVVVAGYEPMATTRIAVILKYLGVKNVYVMGSAYNEWVLKGYDREKNVVNKPKTAGTDITSSILNSDVIDTQDEVAEKIADSSWQVIDTRTKEEYDGLDTGYNYHDIAGRIDGTILSESGIGYSSSMYFYRNPDSSMRSENVLKAKWYKEGVDYTNKKLSFFCGSGWRASEEVWDAWVLGYNDASLYSDGWQGWSNAGREFIDKDGKVRQLNPDTGRFVVDFSTLDKDSEEWASYGIEYAALDYANDYVIDVRPTDTYSNGHIVGSSSFPVPASYSGVDKEGLKAEFEKANGKRVVIVCVKGRTLAGNAMQALQEEGADMSKVTYLIGGADGLKAGGKNEAYALNLGVKIDGIAEGDVILDVRADAAYNAGHFKGSLRAVIQGSTAAAVAGDLETAYNAVPAGKKLVIVCVSGHGLAKQAMAYYQGAGKDLTKITYLIGGANGVSGEVKADPNVWEIAE